MVGKMHLRIALYRQHQQRIGSEAVNDEVTKPAAVTQQVGLLVNQYAE